jgi:pimeloyl-ACP methyl ester carboxylesterase
VSTHRFPTPRCESFVSASGLRLHIERYDGGSPAVVLIHGHGDGAFVWDVLAPILARRFETIAVDLRGHGDSAWDPAERYDLGSHIADVSEVVDRCEQPDLVLIGHSLGALLTTRLCAIYRPRVVAAVLVDYVPELNPEGTREASMVLRRAMQIYPTVDQYVEWMQANRPLAAPRLLRNTALRSLRRDGTGFRLKMDPALAEQFVSTSAPDTARAWEVWTQQTCPTLLIRGSASAVVSRSAAAQAVGALPRGRLVTLEEAGHSVMLDNPFAFARTVLDFLMSALAAPAPHSENSR